MGKLLALALLLGSLALAGGCGGGSSSFNLDASQPEQSRAHFDKAFAQASDAVYYCASFSMPGSSLPEAACNTLVCVDDGVPILECAVNLFLRGQQGTEELAALKGRDKAAYEEGWRRGAANQRACTNQADEAACELGRCSRLSGAFDCLTRPA